MRLFPVAALMLLMVGTAMAQDAPPTPPPGGMMAAPGARQGFRARFEAANTTQDGRLTVEQARAAHMGGIVKNFEAIDADHKGYITLQDVKAWHDARAGAAQGQPPVPPPQ